MSYAITDPIVYSIQQREIAASNRQRDTLEAVADLNVDKLTELLVDAKEAHTAFEARAGHDVNWPKWYAEYLLGVR